MQLKILYALAVKLPSPLALFVESIGNFTADAQPVTPEMATAADALDYQVSYSPSDISTLIATIGVARLAAQEEADVQQSNIWIKYLG